MLYRLFITVTMILIAWNLFEDATGGIGVYARRHSAKTSIRDWMNETNHYVSNPVYETTCWAPLSKQRPNSSSVWNGLSDGEEITSNMSEQRNFSPFVQTTEEWNTPLVVAADNALQPGCRYSVNGTQTNECFWEIRNCSVDISRLSRFDRAYCIQSVRIEGNPLSYYVIYLEGAYCYRSQFRLALDGQCSNDFCSIKVEIGNPHNLQRVSCCCTEPGCNQNIRIKFTQYIDEYALQRTAQLRRNLRYSIILIVLVLFAILLTIVLRMPRKKSFWFLNRSIDCSQKSRSNARNSAVWFRSEESVPLKGGETGYLNESRFKLKDLEFKEIRARGKFGRIYRAVLSGDTYQEFAIKVVSAIHQTSFQNEIRIFRILSNDQNYQQYIIRYFFAGKCCVSPKTTENCIVTRFYVYGSLFDYLSLKRKLPLNHLIQIVRSMTDGLAYLHQSNSGSVRRPAIAHRDFKSKNVLLADDLTARIADFGLAQVLDDDLGSLHSPVGTARYMAPEVLEGAISFKPSAFLSIDVYAYALVLYEACACCFDLIDSSEFREYRLPFDFVGTNPSPEDMKPIVLFKRDRPTLPPSFTSSEVGDRLFRTMSDCWDQDPDSRLSMACAKLRLRNIVEVAAATSPFAH